MLRVVDFTDTDEFGNEPPDGGVLVVGVKYTLTMGPMGTVEDGFMPWTWAVFKSGPQPYRRVLFDAADPALIPEEELQAKAVLMTAKDATQQLVIRATGTHQQALERERGAGIAEDWAQERVRSYPWVKEAHEIAEWAEAVEHYLWYQRWLCGY